MTAVTMQRIVNKLKLIPDDREPLIMDFIATIEPIAPAEAEAADRKSRTDAFLESFMNVEIDEESIADFRGMSMV